MNNFCFFNAQLKKKKDNGSNNCIVQLSPPSLFIKWPFPPELCSFKKCELFLSGFFEICFPEGQGILLPLPRIPTPHSYKSSKYRDIIISQFPLTDTSPSSPSLKFIIKLNSSSYCFLNHLKDETMNRASQEFIRYMLLTKWNFQQLSR